MQASNNRLTILSDWLQNLEIFLDQTGDPHMDYLSAGYDFAAQGSCIRSDGGVRRHQYPSILCQTEYHCFNSQRQDAVPEA